MEIDLVFYVKSLVILFFTFIPLVSLMAAFKSKVEYRIFFLIIALGSLFCILIQTTYLIDAESIRSWSSILEAIFMLCIAFASLGFVKKFNK